MCNIGSVAPICQVRVGILISSSITVSILNSACMPHLYQMIFDYHCSNESAAKCWHQHFEYSRFGPTCRSLKDLDLDVPSDIHTLQRLDSRFIRNTSRSRKNRSQLLSHTKIVSSRNYPGYITNWLYPTDSFQGKMTAFLSLKKCHAPPETDLSIPGAYFHSCQSDKFTKMSQKSDYHVLVRDWNWSTWK